QSNILYNILFNASEKSFKISPYFLVFSSVEKIIVDIAIPMIIAIKSIAINSPVEKAANKFSGTILNNISDTCGISGLSTEVFGKVKFFPGLKNNASDTPIKTARAVVIV